MSTTAGALGLTTWRSVRSALSLNEQQQRFLLRALMIAIGVRVALLLAGYVVGYIIIGGREGVHWTDIIDETWSRWDAQNYERIAENGYQSSGEDRVLIVFFPLLPLLMRIVHFVVPSYFVAGSIISFVAAVGAGFFIQMIVAKEGGDDGEADRSLWYMSLFPTAYFLAMPYTEALFLFTTMGSFLAARNQRWAWAGVLGMLACTTRIVGVALIPALVLEAFHQNRWRIPFRALWLALVPTGFGIYLALNWIVLGDPLEFREIQRDHWFNDATWPWNVLENTYDSIRGFEPGSYRVSIYEFQAAAMIIGAGLLLAGSRFLRPSYQVFGWVSMILLSSATFQISFPRYLMGMFPLFLVMARLGGRPSVHQTILTSSAILMGVLYVMYATNFGF